MNNVDCSRIPGRWTLSIPSSSSSVLHVQPLFHPFLLFTVTLCIITLLAPSPLSLCLRFLFVLPLTIIHPSTNFPLCLCPPPSPALSLSLSLSLSLPPWPSSISLPLLFLCESIKKLFTLIPPRLGFELSARLIREEHQGQRQWLLLRVHLPTLPPTYIHVGKLPASVAWREHAAAQPSNFEMCVCVAVKSISVVFMFCVGQLPLLCDDMEGQLDTGAGITQNSEDM